MNNPIMRALSRGDGLVSSAWVSQGALSRAVGSGRLVRVLPGIYRAAEVAPSLRLRGRALALYDPNAVIVGRAAATLSWYPGIQANPSMPPARATPLARPGTAGRARRCPRVTSRVPAG